MIVWSDQGTGNKATGHGPSKVPLLLIVDDHTDTRSALVRLLKMTGHDCVGVENGRQALLFMETSLPSLVILDGMMPDMDGLEVLRRMQADVRLVKVPVLFYSADASARRIEQVMKSGAREFIVKGTTIGVLLSQVEKYAMRTTAGANQADVKTRV